MPSHLTIAPKPFKSSYLSIPPTPFSPRPPISPPAPPPRDLGSSRAKTRAQTLEFSPPPPEPLFWLWQCHTCNRVYQLGVTRRCLDDGHFFCAGTTTVKRSKRTGYKKTIRHKACASEFDYQGWKAWGVWRRSVAEAAAKLDDVWSSDEDEPMPLFTPGEGRGRWTKQPTIKVPKEDLWGKDCWNRCDYPSECRWGKQYGVQTPVTAQATVTIPSSTFAPEEEEKPKTSFDDIILDATAPASDSASDGIAEVDTPSPSPEPDARKPSMDDLLQSVKRRKRRSTGAAPSPLASNPTSSTPRANTPSSTSQVLQKAFDDFELDVRKSFGRAGEAVASVLGSSRRDSAALEDEKAEAFVAGLKDDK